MSGGMTTAAGDGGRTSVTTDWNDESFAISTRPLYTLCVFPAIESE
jgi:hypothetical protein